MLARDEATSTSSVVSPRPLEHRPRVGFAMMGQPLRESLVPDALLDRLASVATVVDPLVLTEYDSERARRVLSQLDALITGWGAPRVTPELLAAAPDLQLVAHAAGSIRGLFDPDCYRHGVAVTTAAQANAWPVAQWTLAMILLSGKRTISRSRAFAADRHRSAHVGLDVGNADRTVGIIAASRIGRLVLDLLPAHGFRVLLADPTLSPEQAAELGAELVPLETLMTDSDVVSLHAPILESTKGMITAELLASMKDGATFINSARGILVDHDGLREQARTGRIDLVLDVTWPEPLPADDPLWDLPNVWITPHLAGAQGSELAWLGGSAVAEVECLAAGTPYHHAVDPQTYESMA